MAPYIWLILSTGLGGYLLRQGWRLRTETQSNQEHGFFMREILLKTAMFALAMGVLFTLIAVLMLFIISPWLLAFIALNIVVASVAMYIAERDEESRVLPWLVFALFAFDAMVITCFVGWVLYVTLPVNTISDFSQSIVRSRIAAVVTLIVVIITIATVESRGARPRRR